MSVHNLKFMAGQSGVTSFTSDWVPVGAAGFRRASFTLNWAGAASTAGTLSFEGTDDPTQTVAVPLTLATSHGTFPTVGASAAKALVVIDNCPGWVRLKYTGTGGGAANQFDGWVTRSN